MLIISPTGFCSCRDQTLQLSTMKSKRKNENHVKIGRCFVGNQLILRRTLAVPTKAIFYKNPILMTIPSFSYHTSLILQSAPTTISASFKCLIPQSCQISLFRSWHFSSFHLPFYTVCDPMVKQYPQYFWLMFLPIRSWLFSNLPHK